MQDDFEKIQEILKYNFKPDELKQQLFEYLSAMNGEFGISKTSTGYDVLVLNEITSEEELYKISVDDELVVYRYMVVYEFDVDFYYHVYIAIGMYVSKGIESPMADKSLAKLRYNSDLSLFDVEFITNEFYK
ncbi:MAG: hypothetical protein J0I41_00465 [Filimonas sp.]|nr:hypothetical protein [Filimonas sp.]